MKSTKSSLVALAFAFGGCTPKLNEVKEKEPEAVLEDLSVDGVLNNARISFNASEYIIRCDNGYYFLYELEDVIGGGMMCLSNICYNDENDDGKVEGIFLEPDGNGSYTDFIELNYGPSQDYAYLNQRYSDLLRSLKRNQVHKVWEKYWRR